MGTVCRIIQGQALPLKFTELHAWALLTNKIVRSWEYKILADMSIAWAAAMNDEIQNNRIIQQEQDNKQDNGGCS